MSQLKEISGQSNLPLANVICNMNITNNYLKSIKSPSISMHIRQKDKVNSNAKLSTGDQIIF